MEKQMKFYLLQDIGHICYDSVTDQLIRARNSKRARKIANTNTGDEGQIWEDPEQTSCKEVKVTGEEEIIIYQTFDG